MKVQSPFVDKKIYATKLKIIKATNYIIKVTYNIIIIIGYW